jgi:maltooligosyltrehalose trehalohydrolase
VTLGAHALDGRCAFRVWAPLADIVEVEVLGVRHPLVPEGGGYFAGEAAGVGIGDTYAYVLDGVGPVADPASRSQPNGPGGPSQVIAVRAVVPESWRGMPLSEQVICEIHVGTFSEAGTFAGVAARLGDLAADGYSAIELMPFGCFPGTRGWGYDTVLPFAVHEAYGGASELALLVEAAHDLGLAVIADAIYNHLGPEGAPHDQFGPYRTDRYQTPWGPAINLDGEGSDGVRAYFTGHAHYLCDDLGLDGLRLDAIHAISDNSEVPFIEELAASLHDLGARLGRTITVTAESAAADARVTTPVAHGGLGCDAQWNDDFHHALRVSLTGEHDRYFADSEGIEDLGRALRTGFVRAGAPSVVFGRRHGRAIPPPVHGERLVVFAQNHDQIGNGGFGERLAVTIGDDVDYLLAAVVLASPFVPLRFMGEEYGERAPFHFFTSFGPSPLADAVREGRAREVGIASGNPPPDPEDPATPAECRLDWAERTTPRGAALRAWQRELIALRIATPALSHLAPSRCAVEVFSETNILALLRPAPEGGLDDVLLIAHLAPGEVNVTPHALQGRVAHPLASHRAHLQERSPLAPTTGVGGPIEGAVVLESYGVALVALRP